MNSLHVFIFGYALCSLALFIAVWEPREKSADTVASIITGVTWPLWILVRLFLILKANP